MISANAPSLKCDLTDKINKKVYNIHIYYICTYVFMNVWFGLAVPSFISEIVATINTLNSSYR